MQSYKEFLWTSSHLYDLFEVLISQSQIIVLALFAGNYKYCDLLKETRHEGKKTTFHVWKVFPGL